MHVKAFCVETYHLPLSRTERRVATQLVDHPLSNHAVGDMIGGKAVGSAMTTRVFMSKLRRKLEGSGWTVSSNDGGGRITGIYAIVRTSRR